MFLGATVLVGAAQVAEFCASNAVAISEHKPIVQISCKKRNSDEMESYQMRLRTYVPNSNVLSLDAPNGKHQMLRRAGDVIKLAFV